MLTIRDEHIEVALNISKDPSQFIEAMALQSPGLASVFHDWEKMIGEDHGKEASGRFRSYAGWILGCLHAAHGKFPITDSMWCDKHIRSREFFGNPRDSLTRQKEILEELLGLSKSWAEKFAREATSHSESQNIMSRVLFLADIFLRAAEKENDREQSTRDRQKIRKIADFIDSIPEDGSKSDKNN